MLEHGAEGCNYLLAVDVDMDTVEGYEMSSWARGYGDFVMTPDIDTLRPIPWHEGTVLLMADLDWHDGTRRGRLAAADPAPPARPARRARLDGVRRHRARVHRLSATPTRRPGSKAYRDLEPANLYNVDYSMLGTARVEPLIRRIRNSMMGAGMRVENSKGECNFGQHEINFHYGEALADRDDHVIYKNGAKEIAVAGGHTRSPSWRSTTSSRATRATSTARSSTRTASNVFADDEKLFDRFVAGQLACLQEMTLFFAPQVNSYKRFVAGSFAPTAVAWGDDNRTCSMRVVGHGQRARVENRLPGADVNPYLALAAMIAAGPARDRRTS